MDLNLPWLRPLVRRLVDLAEERTTDLGPDIHRIDPAVYTDPERFALEKEVLFRAQPRVTAFSCDLPDPGDYLVNDDTDVPTLLVRGKDGRVRAFLNSCLHRGAPLLDGHGHCKSRIPCPYHAWSYDLEGRLRSISSPGTFGATPTPDQGLVQLPCDEAYGLIFTSGRPGGHVDARELLGTLGPELETWELDGLHRGASGEIHTKANWKLTLDTYGEGYHFAFVHPVSFAAFMQNTASYDRYGPRGAERHHRIVFPSKKIIELEDTPVSRWKNPLDCLAITYFLFPNVVVFLAHDWSICFRVLPGDSPGETVTRAVHYTRADTGQTLQRALSEFIFSYVFTAVEYEDYTLTAGIQRGLETGLRAFNQFGRNELALRHMHQAYEAALAGWPQGPLVDLRAKGTRP